MKVKMFLFDAVCYSVTVAVGIGALYGFGALFGLLFRALGVN